MTAPAPMSPEKFEETIANVREEQAACDAILKALEPMRDDAVVPIKAASLRKLCRNLRSYSTAILSTYAETRGAK